MTELQDRQAACLKAAGYVKPSKREITKHLERYLFETNGPIPERLIGMIWLYFEKQPSQRAGRDVRYWVAQVASTDETREHLRYVRAEPGRLIATDGHRLHMADDKSNPTYTGWLDPITLTPFINPDLTFPPYDQVVSPAPAATRTVALEDFEPMGKESVRIGDVHLNRRYVREAFVGSVTMRVGLGGPSDPVRFEGEGGRVAIVMPMRA